MCLIADNFPRFIEVYGDGKDSGSPLFRPEFNTNEMFVINSQKIEVDYRIGINVLIYDPSTGHHSFVVLSIKYFDIKERLTKTHSQCLEAQAHADLNANFKSVNSC